MAWMFAELRSLAAKNVRAIRISPREVAIRRQLKRHIRFIGESHAAQSRLSRLPWPSQGEHSTPIASEYWACVNSSSCNSARRSAPDSRSDSRWSKVLPPPANVRSYAQTLLWRRRHFRLRRCPAVWAVRSGMRMPRANTWTAWTRV